MKVSLVCCGRLENRYAIEFVEYYKQLGFDHIYIADNNHDGEEHFEDVLQSYIDDKFVTIIDYRNVTCIQYFLYHEVYNEINNLYDWIFFCDFDEYLTLVEDNNIKDYLSRDCFKEYNQIFINWRIYSDNNLIYDDGRTLLERFTTESNNRLLINGWNENYSIKSIIRGGLNNLNQINLHYFYNDLLNDTTCNNEGVKCTPDFKTPYISYKLSYIKHFLTKTIDEWIHNKCVRGVGDRSMEKFENDYNIYRFFKYNEVTEQKIEYLKNNNIEFIQMNCCYICTTQNLNNICNGLYINLMIKSIDTLLLFYEKNIKDIYILIDNRITNNEYKYLTKSINNINHKRVNIIYKLIDLNITNCIKYPENNINAWKINRIGLLKFFIPYLVDCDNILYIDSDILFNGNVLNDLYKDFNNNTLFKIYQGGYNSGLILFNCNKWRSSQTLLIDIIKYYDETKDINTVDNQTFKWLSQESEYKNDIIRNNQFEINYPPQKLICDYENDYFNSISDYNWKNINIVHLYGLHKVKFKWIHKIYNYIKNNC